MTVKIFDFDDSFTLNIAEILLSMGIKAKIIHWRLYNDLKRGEIAILGPGPGHINEYESLKIKISKNLDAGVFHLGICLGHQLLASLFNARIVQTAPVHGEAIELYVPSWDFFADNTHHQPVMVQRYNSWHVDSIPDMNGLQQSQDFQYLQGKNFISYQFHPESIGTSFPEIFFQGLKNKMSL